MKIVTLGLTALLALAAIAVHAGESHDDARRLSQAGDIRPLEQILELAQRTHPGRTLEAELEHKHERYIYEIKIVDPQGTVWEMKYDARTGELLKDKKDD
jgi:uncharacterized membrane protein YkoI